MKPWKVLATATAPDGGAIVLSERDGELVIRIDGQWLMSSRTHGSEEAMAAAALPAPTRAEARVLVGGLGCGYTLRAVLDRLGPRASVEVAEISAAVLDWNRGLLGKLAGFPLRDPRVEPRLADVGAILDGGAEVFDAVLLDVDNGPDAVSAAGNRRLYTIDGAKAARRALRPGGRLVVWSAGPDPGYVRRLTKAGFHAEEKPVRASGSGGARHTLFIATRPAGR